MKLKQLGAVTALTLVLCSSSGVSLGTTVDDSTIAAIHEELRSSFIIKCKKELQGATNAVCTCLGDQAQDAIDDDALKQCASNSIGNVCISSVINAAATKAMSQEIIAICTQKTVNSNPSPAATQDAIDGTDSDDVPD